MILIKRLRNLLLSFPKTPPFCHSQRFTYVDVKMKWKKDCFFDTIDIVNKSKELRPLLALKNIIAHEPSGCIPVSDVSKRNRELEISGRVAAFLRRFPAVFEEFTGPEYNLPWFKLTPEAIAIHREEILVYEQHRHQIIDRLRRVVLMSKERRLPLKIVQGLLWFLGLPEDFLKNSEEISNGFFRFVEMGDGEEGLSAVIDPSETFYSVVQKNEMKKSCRPMKALPPEIAIPLFPSKGLRLKRKIEHWLEEFQRLPYVSPYEDFSALDPNSDVAEKRVVGVLHELLSLFVDNSAERRKLLCLKKHLGLPQKFHRAFERHPHVFYLLLKNKTCTVVLKEAYYGGSATKIERHPMLKVRKKYVRLMNKSAEILRSRRSKKPLMELPEESGDGDVNYESREGFDEFNPELRKALQN